MKFLRVFAFVLLIFCWSFILIDFFYVKKEKHTETEKKVISIWHVDTFEGGVGSRRGFLFKVASAFEKENPNVLIMVTNYTTEGVQNALEKGSKPDMISFGCGIEIKGAKEINIKSNQIGGKIEDKTYAIPWCKGCYVLISKNKTLPENKVLGNVIVSQGEYTQPLVCLLYNGFNAKNVKIYSPQYAYSEFICGKTNYFVGTQRDAIRLTYKNYDYSVTPLAEFNDLYQYISILSEDKNFEICKKFCTYLLSEKVQKSLDSIKMFSDKYTINYDDASYKNIQNTTHNKTLSIFSDCTNISYLQELSLKAIKGEKDAHLKIKNIIL